MHMVFIFYYMVFAFYSYFRPFYFNISNPSISSVKNNKNYDVNPVIIGIVSDDQFNYVFFFKSF